MSFPWIHNASPEVNAISQYPTILAVTLSLTTLMVAVICLRVYVRGYLLKTVGSDDYVIFFSAICSIIYSGLCIGQSRWGLGLPIALRPAVNLNNYSVINFTGRPFYMIGITGFKVALCLSYLRILNQSSHLYRNIIWVALVSCTLCHLAGTFVLLFQCSPVSKSWKPLTPGTCLPNDVTFYALAGVTIFFDCVIFFLPIPVLLRLKINNRRKAALVGVFTLGLFTTVCSVMRMVQIISIAANGNSTMLVLWGTVEMNVGIILTCIPTLTPLFKYYSQKSANRSKYGYTGYTGPNTAEGTAMSTLKSQASTRVGTSHSPEDWKEEEYSHDNSSQKNILGLENSLSEQPGNNNLPGTAYQGITATTKIEVSVSDLEPGSKEDFKRITQRRW